MYDLFFKTNFLLATTNELQGNFETVGGVIPAFIDIRTKLTQNFDGHGGSALASVNPRSLSHIVYCKKFAELLRSSLVTRLSYVLSDTYYVLGTFCQLITGYKSACAVSLQEKKKVELMLKDAHTRAWAFAIWRDFFGPIRKC